MSEPWGPLVRRGEQALLEGRFRACERLAREAAALDPAAPEPELLAIAACREQGRVAEAEVAARRLLADHPDDTEGRALLAAVLADLGRDGEARRQLEGLGLPGAEADRLPAVAALAAEVASALDSPEHAEALLPPLAASAPGLAGFHGSTARHLGLVCHVLGRWDEAEEAFRVAVEANGAAGAPVLVAHTRRHYSALLRARGADGDWERAIDLLAEAADVYRRLDIERLADEAEAVLRRSQHLATSDEDGPGTGVFHRSEGGWDVAYGGRRAVVADVAGLRHIAALVAAAGRPVHAVDLLASGGGEGVGDEVLVEYRARLAEVEAQVAAGDSLAAALARAERDFLVAELAVLAAGVPAAAELGDRARRLVALRVRTGLDAIEHALPALGRHLRRTIRTGTFCLYQPDRHETGLLAP